jgi:hypothetical protein
VIGGVKTPTTPTCAVLHGLWCAAESDMMPALFGCSVNDTWP